MRTRESITLNVARGRTASQSSLSVFSKPDDPARAVNGHPTGGFSFCTSEENSPWWQVDLGAAFPVREIVVYNRDDAWAFRAVPLIVSVSTDGVSWSLLAEIGFVFGGVLTGTPLRLRVPDPLTFRYLRLVRTGGPQHFHIDQVEVLVNLDDLPRHGQLAQDIWVIAMTSGRHGGRFVEIGSTDGVSINNTVGLERQFGWTGVCVEPNPDLFAKLQTNRTAHCVQRAVFGASGERVRFLPIGEIGTISGFGQDDNFKEMREREMASRKEIEVETMSPNDLLGRHGMPQLIDFLSLDTEGSEYEILSAFDFSRHRFALMAIEHNFVEKKRSQIYDLVTPMGYRRLPIAFDDLYFHPFYLDILNGFPIDLPTIISWFDRELRTNWQSLRL